MISVYLLHSVFDGDYLHKRMIVAHIHFTIPYIIYLFTLKVFYLLKLIILNSSMIIINLLPKLIIHTR